MKRISLYLLILLVVGTVAAGLATLTGKTTSPEAASPSVVLPAFNRSLTIGNVPLKVAIADTEVKREQGLSYTRTLAPDQGMLFMFDAPQMPSFWMKDMQYDLDMIWIGADKTVKDVTENAMVASYPSTIFTPKENVLYVLEVPAGFARAHTIRNGTSVLF